MKTIGAKELRTHLDQVLDAVLGGEDVVVQHRFKQPVRLTKQQAGPTDRTPLAGLLAFEAAPKRPVSVDPAASVKELYRQSISKKYAQ